MGRCCLEKVDLLVAAGSAAEVLPLSLSCPLPILRTPPPPFASLLLVHGDGSKQYSIRTAGGKPIFVWEAGWKEPLWYNPSFSCIGILKILHSQAFAAIYIRADKAGS